MSWGIIREGGHPPQYISSGSVLGEVYWGRPPQYTSNHAHQVNRLPASGRPPTAMGRGQRVECFRTLGKPPRHWTAAQRARTVFWAAQICFPIFSWRDNLEQRSGPRVEARCGRCEYCGRSVSPRVLFGTLLADRHCSPHGTAPRSNEASNQITSDSVSHNKSIRVAQRQPRCTSSSILILLEKFGAPTRQVTTAQAQRSDSGMAEICFRIFSPRGNLGQCSGIALQTSRVNDNVCRGSPAFSHATLKRCFLFPSCVRKHRRN